MFCQKCGKQIADTAKFCDGCGAPVSGSAPQQPQYQQPRYQQAQYQQPQYQQTRQPEKKQKSKAPVWVSIVVVLAVFLIGRFVIAPAMLSGGSDSSAGQSSGGGQYTFETAPAPQVSSNASASAGSSAYAEIFSSRLIVEDMTPASMLLMDTASFAIVYDDGTVEKMEFGYQDDVIKALVDTAYYPISGYTDDQIAQLETQVKAYYAAYEQISCCTVTYSSGSSFYKVTLSFTGLDIADNIQDLVNVGMMESTSNSWISMSESEANMLASGFVKK